MLRRPFGSAVDIVAVQQRDGGLKCTPWYVRFGRLQGILGRKERVVGVSVNGVESGLHMYVNRRGGVYFPGEMQGGSFVRDVNKRRWFMRRKAPVLLPTTQELGSLNLKQGRNKITFTFMSPVLGKRQIEAGIYVLPWSSKLLVSDVDGTITRSDVLGQVMPLLGRDWSQAGVTQLFASIKNNGYQVLFLSSRAISQARLTRDFLKNLEQNGVKLPDGPVVISPDGVFPSLYREVIKRTPHEFKIGCLEEIRSLFPLEYNPFYAGFGNRNTDAISYLQVGIPQSKIFTINPKGELIANTALNVRCYTSLHKLVDEMFPPVKP